MENETAQIVRYERVLWIGVNVALTWISYAQWMIIYLFNFARITLKKLKFRNTAQHSISEDAKLLTKVPKHLAFILEEEAELEDLANVIIWSFLLGTPYVTIHQFSESTFAKVKALERACEERSREYARVEMKISYHRDTVLTSETDNCCHLMMSSVKDGRRKFAETAKLLCEQTALKQLQPEEIDVHKINDTLQDHLPEPDLAISFSSFPCFHGFQPWSIRLTEIITLPSSRNITYSDFLRAIEQFANCRQRFGK